MKSELLLTKGLVEVMGGELSQVNFHSEEKGYAFKFKVQIPSRNTPNLFLESETDNSVRENQNELFAKRHPLKILLAEDNLFNKLYLDKTLSNLGYENTSHAENGYQVMRRMEDIQFDITFLDINMPEMDGIEVTMEIVKRYGSNRPKIIAVPADIGAGAAERFRAASMDSYLSKPFTEKEIMSIIRRFSKTNRLASQ